MANLTEFFNSIAENIDLSKFTCKRDDPLLKVVMKKRLLKKYRVLFNLKLEESKALLHTKFESVKMTDSISQAGFH